MNLLKCHGSSNDFFLVDERTDPIAEVDRKDLTTALCDRRGPFGADGVLFVDQVGGSFGMRIFNADGGEAEMCGNGLRCVGRYAIEDTGSDALDIRTMKETIHVASAEALAPGVATISYATSAISFELASLPMTYPAEPGELFRIPELSRNRQFMAVSIPNPHVVTVAEAIDEEEVEQVGAAAQRAGHIFPSGVNVSFVRVFDDSSLQVATYERGVGLTQACGTAMSATCVVATRLTLAPFDRPIEVYTSGGMVRCLVRKSGDRLSVRLDGNATFTYRTTVDVSDVLSRKGSPLGLTALIDEIDAYDHFLTTVKERVSLKVGKLMG